MSDIEGDRPYEFVRGPLALPDVVVSALGYRTVDRAPMIHRGLPSPSITFVLSLDDEPIVTGWSSEQAVGPDAYRHHITIGGMHTRPAYIAQPAVQVGIQVAVRPLAARALFGVPPGELDQLAFDGVDVLGPSLGRLREQLAELPDWQRRFDALAAYLSGRMTNAPERGHPRGEVAEAWRWLARHRGTGSMDGLARHVALSPRQLTSVFRGEVGLSPKAVSGLMRFEHAKQMISRRVRSDDPVDIAAVAHATGFYDHSHLVRDFRRYIGLSPSDWMAEARRNIQAGGHQASEDWSA